MGFALYLAHSGGLSRVAKPLRGCGGTGVVEIFCSFDGNTYRTVFTGRFEEAVDVLHAFQKKSKSGIGTPPRDSALVNARLKRAQEIHNEKSRK